MQETLPPSISNYNSTPNISLMERVRHKVGKVLFTLFLWGDPKSHGKLRSEVGGIENIPTNTSAVFATTHLTDQDVILIAQYLNQQKRKLSIVSQSSNFEDRGMSIGMRLIGSDRFLPIASYRRDSPIQGSNWGYSLHGEDFRKFKEVLERGSDLVIAGHRPTHDGRLPKQAAIGAIISGYLTGKPVIPSIVRKSTKSTKVTIHFLSPLILTELNEEEKGNLLDWIHGTDKLKREIFTKIKSDAKRLHTIYAEFLQNNS